MNTIYLFDVDGTLTYPRMPMKQEFAEFFYGFCSANLVYLVSGSDLGKIQEQVPEFVLDRCRGVYCCNGAQYYEKGINVYAREHTFAQSLLERCNTFVDTSKYVERTGNHIEMRPGLINISAVGRNASPIERAAYNVWDQVHRERERFVEMINELEPDYEASAGGEISIDIAPKGWNKSVVKKHVLQQHPAADLQFFGDRMMPGGNDLPLARALEDGTGRHTTKIVKSFTETWRSLEIGKPAVMHQAA